MVLAWLGEQFSTWGLIKLVATCFHRPKANISREQRKPCSQMLDWKIPVPLSDCTSVKPRVSVRSWRKCRRTPQIEHTN